jgi:hypothetical protein
VSALERGRRLSYGGNSEDEADFFVVRFPADAGMADAGAADGGEGDAGTVDTGTLDGGTTDAGTDDAGAGDAGPTVRRLSYAVGCSCSTESGSPVALLLLLWRASRLPCRARRLRG